MSRPVFRQALETVEAMHRALADRRDLRDRAAVRNAEFQNRTRWRLAHAVFQHLGRVFEDHGLGHVLLGIIRRLRARAHLQFIKQVAREILVVEAADEPFGKGFLGHERVPLNARRKLVSSG
jgi:hypothetical protein